MTSMLQQYANVRREEGLPVFLAVFYFFCILTALMVLRPAREALGVESGMDAVRWLFMGTLVVTLLVNPLFSALVSRFRRIVFITATYAFFIANLVLFWGLLVLAPATVGEVSGMVFYVWMSVFNLFVTMVFWALMADRFTLEQSKRLFALIAVGGTVGAIFGSFLAAMLAERTGTPSLLLVAVVFLTAAIAAAWSLSRLPVAPGERAAAPVMGGSAATPATLAADRSAAAATPAADRSATPAVDQGAVIGGSALEGFRAVFRSRYLLGISAYVLILAVVVTFIYFTRLQMVAAMGDSVDMRTGIFARIDMMTQTATLILQAIVAGHLMKRLGVAVTLAILPVTVALGFIGLAIMGSIGMLVALDATQRAVQRAIMRPARETLFTVVGREDKYKAKAFIDTFVYRSGDVVGAQVEGALGRLGAGLAALTMVTVPLALVWAALGIWLGRAQERIAASQAAPREQQQDSVVT